MKAQLSTHIGGYFLAFAIMLNEGLLGFFLSPTGEILSTTLRAGILAQQVFWLSLGLLFVFHPRQ